MLPEGWRHFTVGEACSIKNNFRYPLNMGQRATMKGPYPYFGPTGVLDYLDHFRINEEFSIIGEDGDHFLKFRDRPMTLLFAGKANVNNHAHIVGDSRLCSPKWFYYWFMHRDLTPALSRQGVGRYKLTKAGLEELEIWLPPKDEQLRIAAVLATWEKAIDTTEQRLANLRRQTQVLEVKLLKGRRRGDSAHSCWSYVDLSHVFDRVTRKNSEGNTDVLTISGEHGLISQRDFFKKRVASENLSGYTLLRSGEFAYNKSYSTGYPMGAIKPLMRHESGVVSSLYICFRVRDGIDADPEFFRHYLEAGLLNDELSGIAQEGARNHGLLNVGVGDFFKLRLHIPDGEEQRRVARILRTAESEEHLVLAQLEALRNEKRALMQQLLTGQRRLPALEPEAETVA